VDAKTTSCVPYACDASGCLKACTTSDQCATGYKCDANKCVPSGATCSTDGLKSVPKDGTPVDCTPYLCSTDNGECRQVCTDSSQCAPGYSCDPSNGTCAAAGGSGSDGGCATGGGEGRAPWLVLAGALVAGLGAIRRRRFNSR
jgi:MYXO-CTERM domain-containing protein